MDGLCIENTAGSVRRAVEGESETAAPLADEVLPSRHFASGCCRAVCAATEIAMKEKKPRVEDALHATRAAVEEGVVPGGGVALVRVQRARDTFGGLNEDQTVGIRILSRAIEEPLRQIVEHAGEGAAVVLNTGKAGKAASATTPARASTVTCCKKASPIW